MPDDRDSTNDDAILAVGGLLFVGPFAAGRNGIRVGPAAGWMVPRGIAQWESELSFVPRALMTTGLATALRATLAEAQIAPKRFPMATLAVQASPLLALTGNLVDDVKAQGIRVHTVGVDRVSGDFYYFEEGGPADPLRVQGNLVDMLAPSLGASSTNAEIAIRLDGLIDRLLMALSEGVVSELGVELAAALPRLSRDGTGLVGTNLEAFEAQASAFAAKAARWEAGARGIPAALDQATSKGLRSTTIPLFGEANLEGIPALEVLVADKVLKLPERPVWTVTGAPREEAKPAPSPVVATVAAKPAPSAVTPRATPEAAPTRPSPSGIPPRATPSPAPAKPVPSPTPVKVTPAPSAVKPAPSPAAPRVAPEPVRPAAMRLTPIPPRPDPVQPTPAPAPVAAAPSPESAPTPVVAPAPARSPESAPTPSLASAATSSPESAPTPALARTPSPESAPTPVVAPAPESAPQSAPALASARESAPARASTPASSPARPKRSPATLALALLALAALAYVAFERIIH